jgi:hypothetical protein
MGLNMLLPSITRAPTSGTVLAIPVTKAPNTDLEALAAQFAVKPTLNTPPDAPGLEKTSTRSEKKVEPEVQILSITPEAAVKKHAFKYDPEENPYTSKGTTESPYRENPRDTVRYIIWLYAEELAKKCKSNCPMVRKGKCKCQGNGDRVISDIGLLLSNKPLYNNDENIWDKRIHRFLKNMIAMLEFFWSEHGLECPPSGFDLGYYGFKLLQAFKNLDFWVEKLVFEPILKCQYRAALEEILRTQSMRRYMDMEEVIAREEKIRIFLRDDTYSNISITIEYLVNQ